MQDGFTPRPLEDLITRAYKKMAEDGTLHTKSKLKIPVKFNIYRKNRKTYITQFKLLCDKIRRDPEMVQKHIATELTTQGSIVEDGSLKLTGSLPNDRVMNTVVSYMKNYVQCSMCYQDNTEIVKIAGVRQMQCNKCGAITRVD